MCRTGGRRCPTCSDPVKSEVRNAKRRAKYAADRDLKQKEARLDELVLANLPDDSKYGFGSLAVPLISLGVNSEVRNQHESEAKEFNDAIQKPGDSKTGRYNESPRSAINFYTANGFRHVRNFINDPDYSGSKSTDTNFSERMSVRKTIRLMDKALSKAKPPVEPRKLYRGVNIEDTHVANGNVREWLDRAFPVGGVISQKNYMSTTRNPGLANDEFAKSWGTRTPAVIFEIMSRQGAALGYGTSSQGMSELEVLIPRNAKFKVVSVTEDVKYRVFSEHDPEGKFSSVLDNDRKVVIRLVDVDMDSK